MESLKKKFQDNKDFYLEKYQKYKDKKKNGELKPSNLLNEAFDDYAEILERSNKPVSRLRGKTIKSYKKMFKDGNI